MHRNSSRRRFLRTSGATVAATGFAGCFTLSEEDAPEFTDSYDPKAILLTWQQDPTTTMTIDWHTPEDEEQDPALDYRPTESDEWQRVTGITHSFEDEDPNTTYGRDIQRIELLDLEPSTDYEFRVGNDPIWSFRTMPKQLDEPLTFASGGDTGHGRPFDEMLSVIVDRDPEFLTICGDFPIADGGRQSGPDRRWMSWFESVKEGLITDSGRIVPIVGGIGNHECRTGYVQDATNQFPYEDSDEWREWQAPYFYSFFAFPGHPGYGVLDFGDYLSIPMLDTDHTAPIRGRQTDWLASVLADRSDVPHVFPNYHVPIYPGVNESSNASPPLRNEWPPLFEEHGIQFTFEHHIHHFKRSVPIAEGEPDDNGVVYMGNGNLGQMAPSLTDPDRWWIDTAAEVYNVHFVTIDGESTQIESVDNEGAVLDTVERSNSNETVMSY